MKFIFCDKDRKLIPLSWEKQGCKCGRISGVYNPDQSATIWYKSRLPFGTMRGCRVLAIDTNLLTGHVKASTDYVFDWRNSGLTVFHNKKLIQLTPPNYAEKNAVTFLGNAASCLKKINKGAHKKILLLQKEVRALIK